MKINKEQLYEAKDAIDSILNNIYENEDKINLLSRLSLIEVFLYGLAVEVEKDI
jgi:hypothetical protein